jgi:hypothetical protein
MAVLFLTTSPGSDPFFENIWSALAWQRFGLSFATTSPHEINFGSETV